MRLDRLRLQPDERFAFFQGFLKNPARVGSVIPSSRFLERRVVELAEVDRAQSVVELGPGTGGTTRALLRAMAPEARLLGIELDADFVRILSPMRDPRLVIHHGDARDLERHLRMHRFPAPEVVVSGIPFSTMPRRLGREIVQAVFNVLAPGGRFVAYQVRDRVGELGREFFGRPQVQVELLNVPPMRVYRWVKPSVPLMQQAS
ncbi:MAG: methyltransferase type 12 [Azospira oryzae]|uniref:Methyltransferase domain-containing protein n=1 Tax=Pelomicrobium methylotrophicum TaxID=2602750 RepID=A0A5C7EW63_9PROT|nr:MAG: methyltransferase type 12 [Azospira oryzae]PZP81262.1 MAG: methyltransferase type 12 [Azospira oryzae]TXF11314.1 methyltransferase domain-containing protein [Pelomicrobium methylotrophicum]